MPRLSSVKTPHGQMDSAFHPNMWKHRLQILTVFTAAIQYKTTIFSNQRETNPEGIMGQLTQLQSALSAMLEATK